MFKTRLLRVVSTCFIRTNVLQLGICCAPKFISRIFKQRSQLGIPDKTVSELLLVTNLCNLNPLQSRSDIGWQEVLLESSSESDQQKAIHLPTIFNCRKSRCTSFCKVFSNQSSICKKSNEKARIDFP